MSEPDTAAPVAPGAATTTRPKVLGALVESFGPLALFYAVEHLFGLVPAIISGVAIGVLLVILQIVRDRRVSTLTAFTAVSVLVFGVLDLRYQSGFFVKLEPALGNGATGLFLLATLLLPRNPLAEMAEQQLGHPLATWQLMRLRAICMLWGGFFLLRAAAFVWMAYHLELDRALFWRATAGNGSFIVLVAVQVGYFRLRRRRG